MCFLSIYWLSLEEDRESSLEIGRPRWRRWKNFGCRWIRGVSDLENWVILMDVICVSSLNRLEKRNANLQIAISHVIKSAIINGRNCLSNYIAQSSYWITEISNCSFTKNNIETKDCCKYDELYRIKFVRISLALQMRASYTTKGK